MSDCPGQVECVFGQVKTAPNLSVRASENDCGEFYLSITSYVSCILRYFVDYRIPLSQIKIVLFILANRDCLIRWRHCVNIIFIFVGQWKARVICGVLILENYPWCDCLYDQNIESVIDYWNKNSNKLYSRCQSMIRNIYTSIF